MFENTNGNYVGMDAAAAYLKIKTATLRSWVQKELVPAHKVGGLWKFRRSGLDGWIRSRKRAIH